MSNPPKISIITPTFNAAATIAACIESVAEQTYPAKEHWIIDGVSTDDTMTIVQQYAAVYPHIRYVSEKDKGIYDAMNKGIALSEGEWLYFLGADDTFYNNQVLENIPYQQDQVQVIYGDVLMPLDHNNDFSTAYIYGSNFDYQLIQQKNICHQSIFYRREIFHLFGSYNLKYKFYADWDFNLKWMLSGSVRSIYINRTIAKYSRNGISSRSHDRVFAIDKPLLILQYGRKTLPPEQLSYLFYTYVTQSSPPYPLIIRLITKLKYLIYKFTGVIIK
jgi:glycosyltransferase involved in cell wall biosynthesis